MTIWYCRLLSVRKGIIFSFYKIVELENDFFSQIVLYTVHAVCQVLICFDELWLLRYNFVLVYRERSTYAKLQCTFVKFVFLTFFLNHETNTEILKILEYT